MSEQKKNKKRDNKKRNIVVRASKEGWEYWGEVCENPKQAATHALTLLQLIPGVGGVIKDNITEYLTSKKEARIEELFAAIFRRLGDLESAVRSEYVRSDEYTHLMVHTVLLAQFEHRELKLKMLGYTLAELTAGKWSYQFDMKKRLLDLVGEMGEDQAEILQILASKGVQPLIVGSHHPLSLLDLFSHAGSIQSLEPRRREIILKSAVDWLEARGLAVRSHNRDGSNRSDELPSAMRNSFMSNEFCSITPLGLDLAQMIQSEP